jgi:hypothetical protein
VIELPDVAGWGCQRMVFHELKILVEPVSATATRNCLIAKIDLKMPLPQSILALVGRKVSILRESCVNRCIAITEAIVKAILAI